MTVTTAVDGSDPLVAAIAWGVAYMVGRFCPERYRANVRPFLPMVAVLGAVGARAAIAEAQGAPLTLEALLRSLAAAGVAVLGHSQARELSKLAAKRAQPVAPPAE